MSTTVKTRNGIDTQQLLDTIDAIQNDDSLAQFTFKARSTWEDGTHSKGRIGQFVHAGNEDETRDGPFELDGDEPPVLLGSNQGPNAVELLWQSLAFLLRALAERVFAKKIEKVGFADVRIHDRIPFSIRCSPRT